MGPTTELRRHLKSTFYPFAEARGFRLDNRHAPTITRFRRPTSDAVHLFELQWEKYGRPRFVVNFGACPPSGLQLEGRQLAPEELFVGWLPGNGRLQPLKGTGSGSWFRQDKPWLGRLLSGARLRPAAEVVEELLELFPEVERYWNEGRRSEHLYLIRETPRGSV